LKSLNNKNLILDVIPFVYQIVHPNIREINIQILNNWEKEIFLKALEFMVLFNISIKT